ncbi:MAG: histidinol dehydrogenase [Pseudomonadota bacterium]
MPSPLSLHRLADLDLEGREALCRRAETDLTPFMEPARAIVEDVKTRGDAALIDAAAKYEGAYLTPETLKATTEEFDAAPDKLDGPVKDSIRYAVQAVRRFHAAGMPEPMWFKEMEKGVMVGERTLPIDSVAGYVPRGKGAFPSVAIMVSVPAVVAGVARPILLTPPLPDGSVDAATLFVAREAGVEEVYKVGGAQAVAAVAYGTQSVPRCRKIVGPGSPWLGAARRLLADVIDPGMPAGPSESIVFADETADPVKTALDLITESEHGSDSSVFLVTTSQDVIDAVGPEVARLWMRMGEPWASHSRDVLTGPRGGIVLAESLEDAVAFTNAYAPEHLLIESKDPWPYLPRFRHAGEILLGENAPFGVANYVLGANNVLPTSGYAHTRSATSVHDFLVRQTVAYVTSEGYETLAPHAHTLATYEGFEGHANATGPLRGGATPMKVER